MAEKNALPNAGIGLPPAPAMLFSAVQAELRDCLKEYRDATEKGWKAIFLSMDQQFSASGNQRKQSMNNNMQADIFASCDAQSQSLRLYHGFETAGEPVPLRNTPFRLHQLQLQSSKSSKMWAALAVQEMPFNDPQRDYYVPMVGIYETGKAISIEGQVKNLLAEGEPNRLNAQGMAEIVGLDCSAQYAVTFSPQITQDDFDRLFASYAELIDAMGVNLLKSWTSPDEELGGLTQCAVYTAYYNACVNQTYTGVKNLQLAEKFIRGVIEGLFELWDGLRKIFLWVTNPESYASVAQYLSNPAALADELIKAKDKVAQTLSLLKDEAMLFILMKSLLCYFKLLTPDQLAEMASEQAGKIMAQIVVSLILPASLMTDSILDMAFSVGAGSSI